MTLFGWMRWKALLAGLLLLSPLRLEAAEPPPDGSRAFEQLSSLVGEWEGKFEDGRTHRVAYRMTAGGAVLVETWALAPGRESMTLYHRDGDTLLADHYCPQGNTPRLELAKVDADGKIFFKLRDGTNLQVPGKSHQQAFWLKFKGPDAYARSETYVGNVSADADMAADAAITYTRVAAPAP